MRPWWQRCAEARVLHVLQRGWNRRGSYILRGIHDAAFDFNHVARIRVTGSFPIYLYLIVLPHLVGLTRVENRKKGVECDDSFGLQLGKFLESLSSPLLIHSKTRMQCSLSQDRSFVWKNPRKQRERQTDRQTERGYVHSYHELDRGPIEEKHSLKLMWWF